MLDICGAKPLAEMPRASRGSRCWPATRPAGGRRCFYEYNYEKQFPYTPNVRGVRTDDWKYIHYPHGDGKPDRYQAELYDLKADPRETKNLIDDPQHADQVKEIEGRAGPADEGTTRCRTECRSTKASRTCCRSIDPGERGASAPRGPANRRYDTTGGLRPPLAKLWSNWQLWRLQCNSDVANRNQLQVPKSSAMRGMTPLYSGNTATLIDTYERQ